MSRIERALSIASAAVVAAALVLPVNAIAQSTSSKGKSAATAKPGDAPLGNYLAGRFAQLHGKPIAAIEFFRSVLKSDPANLDVQRRLLAMLVSEGRIDESLVLARAMTTRDGDQDEDDGNLASLVIVLSNMKAGKHGDAEKALASFPKSGLATIIAPLLRAWALAGQKKYDDALKALSAESGNEGFAVLFGAHSAAINELAGRKETAEKGYLQSVEGRQRANLRLTQLLGNFYERNGRAADARKLYEDYLVEHPTSTMLSVAIQRVSNGAKPPKPEISSALDGAAEGMFSLAGSVQQQSGFQAVIFARLALYLRSDLTIARLLIAETLESEKRYEEAIAVYRTTVSDPNYAWAARLRIADEYDALDRPDDAIRELKQMAQEEPKRYDALVRMGDILRRHKRYDEASKAYEGARARIPALGKEHWSMLYASGIAYERSKQWEKAEADFLKALDFEPEQPYVLNYLGYSWVEKGKNLDKARAMIELAVKKRPRDGYIVDSLGWVLFRLGDIEGAVKNLERAVSLRPEDPTINDHLGDVYWRVNRKDEARFQWNRALTLEPEPEEVPKIKKKIKDGLPST